MPLLSEDKQLELVVGGRDWERLIGMLALRVLPGNGLGLERITDGSRSANQRSSPRACAYTMLWLREWWNPPDDFPTVVSWLVSLQWLLVSVESESLLRWRRRLKRSDLSIKESFIKHGFSHELNLKTSSYADLRRQFWPEAVDLKGKLWGRAESLRRTADFAIATTLTILHGDWNAEVLVNCH